MPVKTSMNAEALGSRVRAISQLLFGRTMGNQYRQQVAAIEAEAGDLRRATSATKGVLVEAVFEDHTLAPLTLARMARTRDHAALIFMALDLVNICLMNPRIMPNHKALVDAINAKKESPVALVLECLEWLGAPTT